VWPNVVTFNVLADMLCKPMKMKEVRELFELMVQRGTEPDDCAYSIYFLAGMIDDGRDSLFLL
jgi:pentatricopeptide repeat protein